MTSWVKIALAAAALLLAGSLGPEVTLRQAAADDEIDISVFYTALAPYGEWVPLEAYGWAWVPENVDYGWRPYTVGQWSWVERHGWMWVSEEPWGWATYHYGRWTYADDYGWAWVPGTTWGPAWVAFRHGGPWVGWAPLPPGSGWRFDAAPDLTSINATVSLRSFFWTFVSLQNFAAPDMRSRVYVNAYNPYLVQHTQWSTRYATVAGGYANQSIDLADVERARGERLPRRHLREAQDPGHGAGARVEGDAVVTYRPRIAPRAPAQPPPPRVRGDGHAATPVNLERWTAQRQAALRAHLEAQRKALEQPDAVPVESGRPQPGTTTPREDAAKRREAALKGLEDERKRLESLFERQRKRREREQAEHPRQPPSPGTDDEGHGKKDDGQNGHGQKDHGKKDDGRKGHGKKDDDKEGDGQKGHGKKDDGHGTG